MFLDEAEFQYLNDLRMRDTISFDPSLPEQNWLNEVYKNNWLDIGFTNNAQTMVKWKNETLWSEYEDKISILHFGGSVKPWKPPCPDWLKEICQDWKMYQ